VALTTDQIHVLQTADIHAMSTTQVAAFTSDQLGAMSGEQVDALYSVTPIMLDLNGDGIHTLSASSGVNFDLNGTGHAIKGGWVGAHDGLLVLDRNGDGVVNDGRELFGSGTLAPDGHRAGNGYAALALLDANHDGVLNAKDADFSKLQVWVDQNQNGVTDAGELHKLAELGIVSMDLHAHAGTQVDNGNLLGLVSSYTTSDGQTKAMADVWLTRDHGASTTTDPTAALAGVTAADLLSAAPDTSVLDKVTGSAHAADTSTHVATAAVPTEAAPHLDPSLAVDPLKGLVDPQNNNLLL
jgi:hypothetical protein